MADPAVQALALLQGLGGGTQRRGAGHRGAQEGGVTLGEEASRELSVAKERENCLKVKASGTLSAAQLLELGAAKAGRPGAACG